MKKLIRTVAWGSFLIFLFLHGRVVYGQANLSPSFGDICYSNCLPDPSNPPVPLNPPQWFIIGSATGPEPMGAVASFQMSVDPGVWFDCANYYVGGPQSNFLVMPILCGEPEPIWRLKIQ